ncbi:MAG: hypothetical protein JW987_07070 [Anaerolineaceae bacterium]|nr:hypothetical protein [Anaerolineaceae bacterium]
MSGRWYRLAVTAGAILFAAGVMGIIWTAWMIWRPVPPPAAIAAAPEPVRRATPFQPDAPTATVPAPTPTPLPTGAPAEPREGVFDWLQDAVESGKVRLVIQAPAEVSGGREIKSIFIVSSSCSYGTGRACLSTHRGGEVTLLTIHSGLGGEGEALRGAVEGTGLNMAFFSLERIRRNMDALARSPVQLQGEQAARDDLELAALVRVPPARLEAYFQQPFDEALAAAEADNPGLADVLDGAEDWLVFEICGWQLPGEGWYPGVTPSTGAIYLGFIRVK